MTYEETEFGFNFGSAEVTRVCSDKKKGWVILSVKTPRSEIEIRVTKSGIIHVGEVKKHLENIKTFGE